MCLGYPSKVCLGYPSGGHTHVWEMLMVLVPSATLQVVCGPPFVAGGGVLEVPVF